MPGERTVQVAPSVGGGTEFRYGPLRVAGPAVGWAIVTLIFGGGGVLADRLGAPLVIVGVVALFTALMVVITIDLWLGVTVLDFTHGAVRQRHSWLGLGRTRVWNFDSIRGIRVKTGMTQQRTATQKPRAWYDIEFVFQDGPAKTVLRHLPTQAEAESVAHEMSQLLGLPEGGTTGTR
jgi:hypothetical protein